jgi:Transposase IS66 family
VVPLWAYVRDDQPFGGSDPPAAAFFCCPDRGGEHPEQHLASYAGLMQADAYAGFNRLTRRHREQSQQNRSIFDHLVTRSDWGPLKQLHLEKAPFCQASFSTESSRPVEEANATTPFSAEANSLMPRAILDCSRGMASPFQSSEVALY